MCFHATGSRLIGVQSQLTQLLTSSGTNVISTCEELSYPYKTYTAIASELDRLAVQHRVTLMATGINPGFVMDTWPLFMSGICQSVQQIRAVRVQDAGMRRLPFQEKIGAGRTVKEFDELVQSGALRHVGLGESIAMLASGLHWDLSNIQEEISPIVAERKVSTRTLTVEPAR